ncbi:MAG: peptidylprolyl isomerase [Chloroflexi bacterium]|nr:peptidylprolyl isomerase [Chloroflexota bacterium]
MKRSKRHALAAQAAEKPRPTPRQLSKRAREQRLRRLILSFVSAALALVVLVLAYGYWREVLRKGSEPIVEVGGRPIETELYARYFAFQQMVVNQQLASLSQLAAAAGSANPSAGYQQQIQLLQQRQRSLENEALSQLVEAFIVHQETERREIPLTDEEIDAQRVELARQLREGPFPFLNQLGPSQPVTGTQSIASPTPVLTVDIAQAELQQVIARSGQALTEEQVRELVLEPRVLRKKLEETIGADVAPSAEQVHARHILVEDEQQARDARQRIEGGEDFVKLAQELSKDSGSKEKGGDLGWFGRGQMVTEFEEAAFGGTPGRVLEPVKTSFGYHLIEVIERDANRPLGDEQLAQARLKRFNDWLNGERAKAIYHISNDKLEWARRFVNQLRAT